MYINLYAKYPEIVAMRQFRNNNALAAFLQNNKRRISKRTPMTLYSTGVIFARQTTPSKIEVTKVVDFNIGYRYRCYTGAMSEKLPIVLLRDHPDMSCGSRDYRFIDSLNSGHFSKATFTSKHAAEEFASACFNAFTNDPDWRISRKQDEDDIMSYDYGNDFMDNEPDHHLF